MRLRPAIIFLALQAVAAGAQTPDEVKGDILAALSTPLPITVIGPLVAPDVKVEVQGDSFVATLQQPMLMGIVPLGTVSFKLTPQGPKAYRVTDFTLPKSIELMNAATLGIAGTTFDGVWNAETRSYETLTFALQDVSVLPRGMPDGKVTIGSFGLDVAKAGAAGATESRFALTAGDIAVLGLSPSNVKVKTVTADLKARGQKPVDLYSAVSRFAVLGLMQQDGNALLQFAEGLRAQSYDTVTLDVAGEGVDVTGSAPGSNDHFTIGKVGAVAGLTGVTPDEWATLSLAIDGRNIRDNGILGVKEVNTDRGSVAIEGTRIPIGATLNALSKINAMSRGEAVSYRVSEMLDGLLNMGEIKVTSSAEGIAYVPRNDDDPSVRFDRYSLETGADGFRDGKGRLHFASALEGMNVLVKHFPTAIEAKANGLLNPKVIRYDVSAGELNEGLLRKLLGDVVVHSEQDVAALAVPALTYVMALKPVIDSKEFRFQSAQVDVAGSGHVRFYPAWVLGAMPYEGETRLTLKGADRIAAFFEDLKSTPSEQGGVSGSDATGVAAAQSVLTTLQALAKPDGQGLTWTFKYPKAGEALFLVNDVELRFPDFTGLMGPLMGYGAFGALTGAVSPSTYVEAPPVVDETAPVPLEENPQ